ncbi:hypothetical protein AZI86_07475 [Bdellovibrio bacteriovorus]|uniref:HTH cro/C1-type domain-containing protein n=1 Tax=Bdellovibrio bacteriovorus TaxID=959 RepID=A0A150WR73_BDEBC|nr:helix-turn-helix transcriptional regulator [Bdellovibrio bacteriovorus]KYG66866.1 hypothetical protein AZI86_07475 [Bdellovibrio bacteriovorus]
MNYTPLSEGLRNILKTRNVTYKDIAAKLEMSESGVKKMLTANDISYNKLNAILEMLDLKIDDVVSIAPKPYKKLTEEQERFFEKNPKHFNFFIQLHHHKMKAERLKKANNKLSKEKITKFLEDLERINVLKTIDGDIHSLLEEGFQASEKFNERFRVQYDVLIKSLVGIKNGEWKSWMFEGLGTFSLSQKSALELRNEMQALLDEFSARSEREKKLHDPKELVNTGTLFLNVPLKIQDLFPVI